MNTQKLWLILILTWTAFSCSRPGVAIDAVAPAPLFVSYNPPV